MFLIFCLNHMYLPLKLYICVFVSSLCVQTACDGEGFGKPCTSPPHKGVRAFVCMFLSLACAFGCLMTGKVSGNHAPLPFTKVFKHLCLCVSLLLVRSLVIVVLPRHCTSYTRVVTPQRSTIPKARRALTIDEPTFTK